MMTGRIGTHGTKIHRIVLIEGTKVICCGSGTKWGVNPRVMDNAIELVDRPINCTKCLANIKKFNERRGERS